jgi:hypothetical protein
VCLLGKGRCFTVRLGALRGKYLQVWKIDTCFWWVLLRVWRPLRFFICTAPLVRGTWSIT